MNIELELQTIFQDVFEDETIKIKDNMNASSIEEWDSLAQIQLIINTEKKFKIKFTLREMSDIENVGDFIKLIAKKVNTYE